MTNVPRIPEQPANATAWIGDTPGHDAQVTATAAVRETGRPLAGDRERRIENTIDFAIAHFKEHGIVGAEYLPD